MAINTTAITVLLVENQTLIRQSLSEKLTTDNGLRVLAELADGSKAEVTAMALQPDVVVLAIGNPGEPDLRALQGLRIVLPETAVVALVTGEVPEQRLKAQEYGASAVIEKSADQHTLLQAIYEVCDR